MLDPRFFPGPGRKHINPSAAAPRRWPLRAPRNGSLSDANPMREGRPADLTSLSAVTGPTGHRRRRRDCCVIHGPTLTTGYSSFIALPAAPFGGLITPKSLSLDFSAVNIGIHRAVYRDRLKVGVRTIENAFVRSTPARLALLDRRTALAANASRRSICAKLEP